jgi:hypothetical protein
MCNKLIEGHIRRLCRGYEGIGHVWTPCHLLCGSTKTAFCEIATYRIANTLAGYNTDLRDVAETARHNDIDTRKARSFTCAVDLGESRTRAQWHVAATATPRGGDGLCHGVASQERGRSGRAYGHGNHVSVFGVGCLADRYVS